MILQGAWAHVPRKRFGQHFLSDAYVIDQIVQAIAPTQQDHMVEIGPGTGALTLALLPHLCKLNIIEFDRDLVRFWLAQKTRDADVAEKLTVVSADVLKVDFNALHQASGQAERLLRVVGNLPYNISSPILFHLLPCAAIVQDQHFMLQKEVVDRMVAKPDTAAYGRLSVMMQWRYDMTSVMKVAPKSFDPPPKVMSAVVRMSPRGTSGSNLAWEHAKQLETVVRIAFGQRRKLLRHSLGKWLDAQGYCGTFDLQRRAQEVASEEYCALTLQLANSPH